jgi:RecA-family ATPase
VLGDLWGWLSKRGWPEEKPPERRWLLKRPTTPEDESAHPYGFLPLGKVGMIAAAGGVGKTMALVQLAVSVVTGRKWLGHYTVPPESCGPVFLGLGEEDAADAWQRLHDIGDVLKLTLGERDALLSKLEILPLAGRAVQLVSAQGRDGKPEETPFFHELRRRIEGRGVDWRLLVLDPLSRWAGPETETDNFAATMFVTAVERLSQVRGNPTVLLSHHTTKASRRGLDAGEATAARGASALTDGVRWVASLGKQDGGPLALSLVKTNYTAQAPRLPLKREKGGVLRALSREELEAQLAAERAKPTRKASEKNGKASKPEETDDDPNEPAF